MFGAFLAFAVGSGVAYWVYIKEKGRPARELMLKVPNRYRWALDKWYVDEAYGKTVVASVDALADTAASVDQGLVGFVLGLADVDVDARAGVDGLDGAGRADGGDGVGLGLGRHGLRLLVEGFADWPQER